MATPAEERSDETPQAMNERSSAECIHLRRICHADVGATVFLRCSNAVRVEHKGFDSDEEAQRFVRGKRPHGAQSPIYRR